VDISFSDNKFEKLANDQRLLQKAYGQIGANFIKKRLDDLRAAKTLEDCKKLPGKYHELTENRKGQLATHVEQPNRLIFKPTNDPIPLNDNGGLDWSKVTSIEIIEVTNYHGK